MNILTITRNTLVTALVIGSFSANAGQRNDATIDAIAADQNGLVRVTLSGGTQVSSAAACSTTSSTYQFVYDVNSLAGKGWHAMVLSAQATKKKVHFIGSNSCLNLWGTTSFEAASTIYIVE